ncbi:MAG: response regulator [Deinococcales bacterium]
MKELLSSHILIVDDQEANIVFLEKLFKRAGYQQLYSTADSRQVLAIVQQKPIDLILLDLMMPHLNGFEVMAQLKTWIKPEEYLPILVLTADTQEAGKHKALQEGAMDFLTKPLDITEVLQRTRNLLQTRQLYQQKQRHTLLLEEAVKQRTRELEQANQALEQANLDIVTRLAKAGEYRDDTTGKHTLRVGRLAYLMCLELGLSKSFASLMLRAARLHDIGKIAIPDRILLKPAKLTSEEMEIMRRHCELGANLLADGNSELLFLAESIALHHHERFDGRGYPKGLAGESIPIEGRIVAIIDCYDALIHDRPYKKAWSHEDTIKLIQDEKGKHFDPKVVEAFERVINDEFSKRLSIDFD